MMPSPSQPKRTSLRRGGGRSGAAARTGVTLPPRGQIPSTVANTGTTPEAKVALLGGVGGKKIKNRAQPQLNDPTMVGKRTGITLPPRGQIPLDDQGLEDPDAFFAAAKSPAHQSLQHPTSPGGTNSHGGSPNKAYGKRAEKAREREKREEEKRRRRDELEEEGRLNVGKKPDILNKNNQESNADDDDEEDGGGKPRARFERTPKQPNWSNRLMHQAMGVPTEDSPTYTVLSKVSTAAPSTQGSIETIATEKRHALRGKQNAMQLESVAHGDNSPELGGGEGCKMGSGGEQDEEFDGPMDPPEEMSSQGRVQKRGMDPEERDDVLQPEDEGGGVSAKASGKSGASSTPESLEDDLEEVVTSNYDDQYGDDDGDEGEGGMQLTTQEEDADFGGGSGGGFDDDFEDVNEDDDALSAEASQKSGGTSKSDKSAVAKQPPTPEDEEKEEEEEEESPKKQKKMAKKDAKKQTPNAPTSILSKSKKSKKKKQTNNRVNFSTPTGNSQGIPTDNRDYEIVPVSDYEGSHPPGEEPHTPGGSALRRSRRAKFKPLAYWKNEKLIYEPQNEKGDLGEAMGDMPVVAGVMHALPTPYKEVTRKEPEKKKKKDKKRKRKGDDDDSDSDDEAKDLKIPYDDKALRKKYRIKNGESGSVWSETLESATDIKIVSRIDNRTFSKLPLSATRKKRESKVVGFASQAFHVPNDDEDLFPGYISGNVVLPPRGIKDAEGVGLCSQVFNVGDCQPNSLEFALADPSGQDGEFDPKTAQRYLLNKGDMFQIPPGNVYRIENHSKTVKATLFWTIIKCTSKAEQDDESSDEDD